MRTRSASSGASSSEDESVLAYAAEPAVKVAAPVRYTRQLVDRRQPSTYHLKPHAEQSLAEKFLSRASMHESSYELKSRTTDRGPVPRSNMLEEHMAILPGALLPLLLHAASYWLFPEYPWNAWFAFPIYTGCFVRQIMNGIARLNRRAVEFGTFDEKSCGRDRCPDAAAPSLALAYTLGPIPRLGGAFYFLYEKNLAPFAQFSWTFPIRAVLFYLALDLAFYTYHRATHEIDFLWKIHQKHHTTRHPSPVLGILADDVQEVIEIALVPLFAAALVPLSFSEFQLVMFYLVSIELAGHSGIRMFIPHPILHPFLDPLGLGAVLEDHDLHHRYGKSGKNFGKMSRFWDGIFGTMGERLECRDM